MKRFFYFIVFLLLLCIGFFFYYILSEKGYVKKIVNFPENPFGIFSTTQKNNTSSSSGNTSEKEDEQKSGVILPQKEALFEKVWQDPVAGYSFSEFTLYQSTSTVNKGKEIIITKPISSSTAILFVDRGTGNIYKKTAFEGKATKITNTTVPGVYDAYFFNDNTEIVMRYLRESDNTIMTLAGKLPPLSSSVTLPLQNIRMLPENITSIITSPDKKNLFYLTKTKTGSSLYSIISGKETKIKDFDLSELSLFYSGKNLLIAQKPSSFEKTYFFTTDESLLFGGKTGQKIVFLEKDASYYVSSFWSNDGLKLFTNNTSNTKYKEYTSKTLADKCVSSHIGNYFFCAVPHVIPIIPFGLPDDWYKGEVNFNDSLTILDTTQYNETPIANLENDTNDGPFDLIKPVISSSDTYLAFINKNTNTLWLSKLQKLSLR